MARHTATSTEKAGNSADLLDLDVTQIYFFFRFTHWLLDYLGDPLLSRLRNSAGNQSAVAGSVSRSRL